METEEELQRIGRQSYAVRDFGEVAALLDMRAHVVETFERSRETDARLRSLSAPERHRLAQWLLEYAIVVWGRAYFGPGHEGQGVAERGTLQPWLKQLESAAVEAQVASAEGLRTVLDDLERLRNTAVAHVDGSTMPLDHVVTETMRNSQVRLVSAWMQLEIRHLTNELDLPLWRRIVHFHRSLPDALLPDWARTE